jgi:hypothetical protein
VKSVDKTIPGYAGKPKGALNIAHGLERIDVSKKTTEGKIMSWGRDNNQGHSYTRSTRDYLKRLDGLLKYRRG